MPARLHTLLLPLGVLVALPAMGCSPDSGDDSTVADGEVAALIAEASDAERPYLADGVVTPGEREEAFLGFVDCMAEQGLVTSDYDLRPEGGESVTQQPGALSDSDVDRITRTCRQDRYLIVSAVYSRQHGRSEQQERAVLDQAAQCMRDRGLEVPAGATLNQLSDIDRGAASECYITAERG